MPETFKNIFCAIILVLCCAIFPQETGAGHVNYWCADNSGRTGDNNTKCGQDAMHEDCDNVDCEQWLEFTVQPWQKCESGITPKSDGGYFKFFITGFCNKNCLDYPERPKYWDDPVNRRVQAQGDNAKGVTLPVVLAWDDVRGFGDDSTYRSVCSGKDNECSHDSKRLLHGNGYGPISYRIQIWDDSATGIANLDIPGDKQTQVENGPIPGKKAFWAVLTKKGEEFGFNSRDNGGPCFFASSNTYHWRVTACCNIDGTACKDWRPSWWTFTTSTAPEMKSPLDPDWNGNDAITKSFKEIRPGKSPLEWCAARLPAEYQKEGKPIEYAKSYQMTVTSNESNDFTNSLLDVLSGKVSLSNYLLQKVGVNQQPNVDPQLTHALAIINGNLIYNVYPDPVTGEVETWYPAQSRNDLAFFSRARTYSWKLKSCPDTFTAKCFNEDSQEWKIKTPDEQIPAPQPVFPKDDVTDNEPAAFPLTLSWTVPAGANSFVYQTEIPNFLGERKSSWSAIPNKDKEWDDAAKKLLTLDNSAIGLDKTYRWRVKSCAMFDSGASNPNDCGAWSDWYSFRTTGRPPRKNSMQPTINSESTFPQNFTWEKVPGARSYKIELDGAKGKVNKTVKFGPEDQGQPGAQFDYPDIEPPAGTNSKAYSWRVQTCADDNGSKCGAGQSGSFTVKTPDRPKANPENKNSFGSLANAEFAWNGKTQYYWVEITYEKPASMEQEGCNPTNPIVSKKINANKCFAQNDCISPETKSCLGNYKWKVQPCAAPDCSDRQKENRLEGEFMIIADTQKTKSLMVCGQNYQNLETEWDDTEPCQIKHLFLTLKIIINFVIFELALMILPLLLLGTGGMIYLSQDKQNTINQVKTMWKWIGIGYLLMVFAWLLTSWLMAIAGYDKPWWKIL